MSERVVWSTFVCLCAFVAHVVFVVVVVVASYLFELKDRMREGAFNVIKIRENQNIGQ